MHVQNESECNKQKGEMQMKRSNEEEKTFLFTVFMGVKTITNGMKFTLT